MFMYDAEAVDNARYLSTGEHHTPYYYGYLDNTGEGA